MWKETKSSLIWKFINSFCTYIALKSSQFLLLLFRLWISTYLQHQYVKFQHNYWCILSQRLNTNLTSITAYFNVNWCNKLNKTKIYIVLIVSILTKIWVKLLNNNKLVTKIKTEVYFIYQICESVTYMDYLYRENKRV